MRCYWTRRIATTAVFCVVCGWWLLEAYGRALISPTPSPIPVPVQGVNLALDDIGITGTNAGHILGGPASARDDSLLTAWECANAGGAWMEFDLGRLCRVSGVVVVHPSIWGGATSDDIGSYEIEVRRNPSDEWVRVATVHNNGAEGYNSVGMATAQDIRYIRLIVGQASRSGGDTARIMEWQIWGQALEDFPHWPAPRPFEQTAQSRLAELDSLCGNHEWSRVRDEAQALVNDLDASGFVNENPLLPNWSEYVRGKAMLNLGQAHLETGDIVAALSTWEEAKQSRIRVFAAEAAIKIAHVILPQAQLDRAYKELVWAMGTYPKDIWARIELIDYYHWSKQDDYARAAANEIFDRYPGQAGIEQVAWAECKLATIQNETTYAAYTVAELNAYNAVWEKYKDGALDSPGDEYVVQDVAFHAKASVIDHFYRKKQFETAALHAEELLQRYPGKAGGWSEGIRYRLADTYFRHKKFAEARACLDVLERDFPSEETSRRSRMLRRLMDKREAFYNVIVNN